MTDRPLPESLTRCLRERPEPTPEERFEAYLKEASHSTDRPRRRRHIVGNPALMAMGLGVWAMFGWLLMRNIFGW